jgi:hypothetical protein
MSNLNRIEKLHQMKFLKSLCFLLVIILSSCNKTKPSGFWSDYENNLIVSKHIDNGPYGGETKITWNNRKRFRSDEVIEYAEKNGWKLIDSVKSDSEVLHKSNYSNEILIENILATRKEKDLSIYRFKTGWIAVKPGNEIDTEINGFIILNPKKTQMLVYQLWGE